MIELFPLHIREFKHQFGISAMPESEPIFQTTFGHAEKIRLKRDLLSGPHRDHYLVQPWVPGSQTQTQTIQDAATDNYRTQPGSDVAGSAFVNWAIERGTQLGKGVELSRGTEEPLNVGQRLEWLYRQIQEDVVFLAPEPPFPVTGGCVCFPSGWSLPNKVGQPLLAVHEGVPEFAEKLWEPTAKLMSRLKVGRTVCRSNWGIRPTADLDQSLRRAEQIRSQQKRITADNAMRRCYFRVEFQTLTKLAGIGVVFTIRTSQCPLASLTDEQLACLWGNLQTCPEATLRYKAIEPILEAVTRGIEMRIDVPSR